MTKRVTPLFAVVALGLGGGTASAEQAPAPRTLPSGAPACGNAQSKSPRPCTTAVPTVAKVAPRTLPTGAPACGNVLSKVDGDKQKLAYLECVAGIDPKASIAGYMLMKKTLILLGLRAADPIVVPATPRRLHNGAPAPGNVTRRGIARDQRLVEPPAGRLHHD